MAHTEINLESIELTPAEIDGLARTHKDPWPKPRTAFELLRDTGRVILGRWDEIEADKENFIRQASELFLSLGPEETLKRLNIAYMLGHIGCVQFHDFILSNLKNPITEIRRIALLEWDTKLYPPRNEAEFELLFSCLYDEEIKVREMAVNTCTQMKCEPVALAFEKLLQFPNPPSQGSIIIWFCRNGVKEEHIQIATEFLRHTSNHHEAWLACVGLEVVAQKKELPFSHKALTALEDFFLNTQNPLKYNQGNVRLLRDIGTTRALPAFEEIFARAEDSVSRDYALQAIARMQPDRALALLKPRLSQCHLYTPFLECFQTVATEAQWDELVDMMANALAVDLKGFRVNRTVVDILLQHGRDKGRALLQEYLPKLEPTLRMHVLWEFHGWTIQNVWQDLKRRGLLETIPDPAVIETVRKRDGGSKATHADLLEWVLRETKILHQVSSEPDYYPPNHSHLLAEFSRATGGVFQPRFCSQILRERKRPDSDYIDKSYQISFVHGNRFFEFEGYAMSDYHVTAVEIAVNAALELTGEVRRLTRVHSDAGLSIYLFGEPGNVCEFCAAFAIPLPSDFYSY
ncbi:MAG TPA: hypothetical protein VGH19_07275 [Verrucomicrobiae bacterium]